MKQDANEIPKSLSGTLKFSNPAVKEETKVSHWPGPYKATELDENIVQIRLERYYVHECIHIADVHVMSGNLGEEVPRAVATAELLASAPDLLKENQELQKELADTQINLSTVEAWNAELLQALELVLEAIHFDKNDSFVFDKIQSAINKAKAQ